MRMAGATDNAVRGDERETLLRRIGLAASKYWVCKRATPHAAEAMECLGGNGYVEESGMPRLYREAPLMGIWEGSGNVSALDTLRAMATRPECVDVLFDELARTAGQDPRLDAHVDGAAAARSDDLETIQYRARKIAEDIALALQGSLLVRHGHPAVAEAFLASGWAGSGAARSEPCPPGWTSRRSSSVRWSKCRMTHAIRPVDFDNLKTMTYEVTDRVARITFNRPEKGNAIVADTPLELSALVERADLDPARARHPGIRSGRRLLRRVRSLRLRRGFVVGRRRQPVQGHRAVGQDAGHQPSARSAVGPDDRLPDDEPVRPRLLQPAARRQADGREDPRLLRGGRHRHRAARRSGDRRGRRQDRLSADPGVGGARGGDVGASPRRPARETPSADR